ncbi:hypothetical protein BV898_12425 [Hypsibius exemplaris]|uniref:Uncharacterized protein n=1 Tax=Hypsibius exemplaris TaxID=2072580 RepID=A0A1W0WDM8_HYPEX|nr:hypothetical protein BV898_12425 [Hypsibius exemplaris]
MTDLESPLESAVATAAESIIISPTAEKKIIAEESSSIAGDGAVANSPASIGPAALQDGKPESLKPEMITLGMKSDGGAKNPGDVGAATNATQQFLLTVTSDHNGKIVATVPSGALPVGSIPGASLLRPAGPITVKRGAKAKASSTPAVTTIAAPTTTTVGTPPRATANTLSTLSVLRAATPPQVPQGIRLISMSPFPTTATTTPQASPSTVTAPNAAVTAAAVATTGVKKPSTPSFPVVKTTAAPAAAVGITFTKTPIPPKQPPVTMMTTSPAALLKKATPKTPVVQQVVQKPSSPSVVMTTATKILIPSSSSGVPVQPKAPGKPMAAADKMIQQKRQVVESIVKLRKIERVMVNAKPDQATPFTYGEIFHQAAVSFSKMASLTTHISLESQSPAEQRRWSPDLINKFLNSINTFAGSLKEVGDELKKRHETQLVNNLKRKADTEVTNAKKLATVSQSVATPASVLPPPVTSIATPLPVALPPVVVQNGVAAAVSLPTAEPETASAAPSTHVIVAKHPLEITTDNVTNPTNVALSNLLSTAKTNGTDSVVAAKKSEERRDTTSPAAANTVSDVPAAVEEVTLKSSSPAAADSAAVGFGKNSAVTEAMNMSADDSGSQDSASMTNGFLDDAVSVEELEARTFDSVMEESALKAGS